MRALLGVALNTFREAVRQPFFYLLAGLGAGAILVTLWMPLFTFLSDVDMYKDLGLSFLLVFSMLFGLLAAATGVAREVEDKTAHTILAKSLGRGSFIAGKYMGAMAAAGVMIIALGAVLVAAVYYRVELDAGPLERGLTHGGIGRAVAEFKARQIQQALTVVPGVVLVFLQVGVLASLATALSTRLSAAASVALSLAGFLAGHLTVFLDGATRGSSWPVRAGVQAVLTVLPFLESFNLNQKLSHTMLAPLESGTRGAADWVAVWALVGWAALYAAAYVVAAVGAGTVLFRRRSLS